jgi:hypothetical protein
VPKPTKPPPRTRAQPLTGKERFLAEQSRLRELGEKLKVPQELRDWLNSPEEREARQHARRVATKPLQELDPSSHPRPIPKRPTRRRAKGGGMKRKLSDEQITRGRQMFRKMLSADPGWADQRQAAALLIIEKLKLAVHPRTVQRHIINPVLEERTK